MLKFVLTSVPGSCLVKYRPKPSRFGFKSMMKALVIEVFESTDLTSVD